MIFRQKRWIWISQAIFFDLPFTCLCRPFKETVGIAAEARSQVNLGSF